MKKNLLMPIINPFRNQRKANLLKWLTGNYGFKQLIYIAIPTFLSLQSFATTYYSRTSGGNWNVNTTWSTVTYGNATNTGTYPKAGDVVNIGDGYTININATSACATLNIGQGVSGILTFLSAGIYSLTVSGNVTVNTGGKLWYNTATARTHNCYVGGNFTNSGTVDLYVNSTAVVNLTFNTSSNTSVSGSGTWDLNIVTLNKTTSTATTMDVVSTTFESAIRTFSGIYGTYNHNNAGTYSINANATSFTIGPNVIVKVPLGTMNIAKSVLILQGKLYVNGGTVNVGSNTGTQGLQSDRNGANIPYLEVTSGTLNVYGGITYGSVSVSEAFSFRMTGGTINLNIGTSATYRQLFCVTDVTGSSFYMSGGTVVFQKPNGTGPTVIDAAINGTNGTVTTLGGTFQFGNNSTASGKTFNFKPVANASYPHFKISGSADSVVTLRTSVNSTSDFKLLSLRIESNKVFDIRSISGTIGDTKKMTLLSTADGTNALVNNGTFTYRKSTVTFNTSGAQAIGGTDTTTFYNLTINNASGITLNMPANVSNRLSMVDGKLITTSTNILTCQAEANADLGTSTSYIDGPMAQTVADTNVTEKVFPIGKGSSNQPVIIIVTHSDTLPVTYSSEMFNDPASGLSFANPPGISNVSDVRYTSFTREAVNNFVNGTIKIYYNVDDLVLDYASLHVVQDDGAGQWVDIGGSASSNGSGNIVSDSFNFFNNYFALANPTGGGNPLRLAPVTFNAALSNKVVHVNWVAKTEINTDHFLVERSADNVGFIPVTTVSGRGTAFTEKNYSAIDPNPLWGISYYRLTQVHTDGTQKRLPSIMISYGERGPFIVYPSVSDGSNLHLKYDGNDLRQYHVIVVDELGRQIPASLSPSVNGVDLHLEDSYIKNGCLYFICASNGNDFQSSKILIAKP